MSSAKRILLVPSNDSLKYQTGDGRVGEVNNSAVSNAHKTKSAKTNILEKINKFVKVILMLARNFGYNEDFNIKLNNGKFLDRTNVIDLLDNAMSVGKVLYGESEFIELLFKSGVTPDMIINENIRYKLMKAYNNKAISLKQNEEQNIDIDRRVEERKRANEITDEDFLSDRAPKRLKENSHEIPNSPYVSVIRSTKNLKRKAEDDDVKDDAAHSASRPRLENIVEIEDDQIDDNLWEIPKIQ